MREGVFVFGCVCACVDELCVCKQIIKICMHICECAFENDEGLTLTTLSAHKNTDHVDIHPCTKPQACASSRAEATCVCMCVCV